MRIGKRNSIASLEKAFYFFLKASHRIAKFCLHCRKCLLRVSAASSDNWPIGSNAWRIIVGAWTNIFCIVAVIGCHPYLATYSCAVSSHKISNLLACPLEIISSVNLNLFIKLISTPVILWRFRDFFDYGICITFPRSSQTQSVVSNPSEFFYFASFATAWAFHEFFQWSTALWLWRFYPYCKLYCSS